MGGNIRGRVGFGKWLHKVRLEQGISLGALSVAAGFSSTSGQISRYENGLMAPNDLVLWSILEVLGMLSEWEKWCDKLDIPLNAREYRG